MIYKGYAAGNDPCDEGKELFKNTVNNIRKSVNLGALIRAQFSSGQYTLSTLNIRTQDTLYLNEIMFIPVDCNDKN